MTDTDQFSVDNIETKLMSVLYAHIDTCFSQFALFDKLIKDKFPENYNTTINPIIKAKFLLVLRNLASRYDDIKVEKINNIYSVTCLSDKDNLTNVKNYTAEVKNQQNTGSTTTNINSTVNNTTQNNTTPSIQINSELGLDYADLVNYIIDNNLSDDISYVDPFDGNTIFHDLVAVNNIEKIKILIENSKFDYFVKNKHGLTPIELTKNPEIIMFLSVGLANKYVKDTTELKLQAEIDKSKILALESRVAIYESANYKDELMIKTNINYVMWVKLYDSYTKNKFIIMLFLAIYFLYKVIF